MIARLLIDPPNYFQVIDIKRTLGTEIAWVGGTYFIISFIIMFLNFKASNLVTTRKSDTVRYDLLA